MLRKGVYHYQHIDDWEKFNEISLPEKEDSYSHLNIKEISDADYAQVKKVCKDFKIGNLEDCYDLYVQSDVSLLADVLEIFRNICLEIQEFDPTHFLSASVLAWQPALKRLSKIRSSNWYWYVINDGKMCNDVSWEVINDRKNVWGEICHAIYWFVNASNKYTKNHDKNKVSSCLNYWDINNLYEWMLSWKLPVNDLKWVEEKNLLRHHILT